MVATNLAMVLPRHRPRWVSSRPPSWSRWTPYHVDPSRALAYAVVLHGLNVLPFVLLGIPLVGAQGGRMLRRRGRPGELRAR